MELVYLKTLLRLHEIGNYSQTADALGYSQSSISTHIQRLEQIYGGKIIVRSGNRLVLTSKGKILCRYAMQVLNTMEQMKHALRMDEVIEINIGTIESIALYYLEGIIESFKIKYPDITFCLSIEEESVLLEKLARQELDFVLVFDQEVRQTGFQSLCLKQESLCFVYSTKVDIGKDILHSLETHALILTGEECPYRKALQRDLSDHGCKYRVSMTLSNVDTIKNLVASGWGIGFLPRFTIRSDDTLKMVPYTLSCPFFIQLVYDQAMEEKVEYRYFIDITRNCINKPG